MKTEVYESLGVLNRAIEEVARSVLQLKELAVLGPEFAEIRRLAAEQIRAEINHSVIMAMSEAEAQSALLLAKMKAAEARKLAEKEMA